VTTNSTNWIVNFLIYGHKYAAYVGKSATSRSLLHQTINSTTLGRPQAAPIEAVAADAQRGASNLDVLFKRKKISVSKIKVCRLTTVTDDSRAVVLHCVHCFGHRRVNPAFVQKLLLLMFLIN